MSEVPEWRRRFLARLDLTLVVFELVLSGIFLTLGILTSNPYFRGVGVGLIIAGVTSAIAILYRMKAVTLQ
jgi:hypothetical protein